MVRVCYSGGVEEELLECAPVALPQLKLPVLRLREDRLPVGLRPVVQAQPTRPIYDLLVRRVAPARLRRIVGVASLNHNVLSFVSRPIDEPTRVSCPLKPHAIYQYSVPETSSYGSEHQVTVGGVRMYAHSLVDCDRL